MKNINIEKEKLIWFLFTEYIFVDADNPKGSTQQLLETKNEFIKVIGYKPNIQNQVKIFVSELKV